MTRVAPFSSVKSFIAHIVWHSTSKPGGEREEVERPLVAVHELRGLARADLDHLREVELVARRVIAEHAVERAEHERMRGEIAEARRPREQRAGAARVAAGELVGAGRGRAEVRLELRRDAIELLDRREPLDHRAAGLAERGLDLVDRGVGSEPRERRSSRHSCPSRRPLARQLGHVVISMFGEAGRLVRIGIGAAREAIGDPVDHVAGRRRDHARVALPRIDPPLEILVDAAQVLSRGSASTRPGSARRCRPGSSAAAPGSAS